MVCPCERDVIFLVNRDLHVEGLGKSSLRHVLVRKISDFTVWKKYVRVNLVKQGVMIIMVFELSLIHIYMNLEVMLREEVEFIFELHGKEKILIQSLITDLNNRDMQ